jgi:oligoendopeptidase F
MTETDTPRVRLLVDTGPAFMNWTWDDIEPRYAELEGQELTTENIDAFLESWGDLQAQVSEIAFRLHGSTTQDTSNEEVAQRYRTFVEELQPKIEAEEQRIREKVLTSGLSTDKYELTIRRMRIDSELFREENLPLQSDEAKLSQEYLAITGNQTVEWRGETISTRQLQKALSETDRAVREEAWRTIANRRLQDRETLGALWSKLLDVREQQARNAGFDDYRAYRWQLLKRFDYTVDDAKAFDRAIEEVVVPATTRLFERRCRMLGVEHLRPWDLLVDPSGRPPLHPCDTRDELVEGVAAIFRRLDPVLGSYIDTMDREGLLDVDGRLHKAPIGYMMPLPATGLPFIFFESTGQRTDVETLLHEGGHASHVFEASRLPRMLANLQATPMEFVEVGSMAMEFLGEPYLTRDMGGFYTPEDAARARLEHIESRVLTLWCRIAQGDLFQHWVYEHPDEAHDLDRCDEVWLELDERLIPVIDRDGLEPIVKSSWMAIPHFFDSPFYYIEYGIAQLGAVQIAANARRDEREAVRQYREALALGASRPLPELFSTAGARFAFDRAAFESAVRYLDEVVAELDDEVTVG